MRIIIDEMVEGAWEGLVPKDRQAPKQYYDDSRLKRKKYRVKSKILNGRGPEDVDKGEQTPKRLRGKKLFIFFTSFSLPLDRILLPYSVKYPLVGSRLGCTTYSLVHGGDAPTSSARSLADGWQVACCS